MFRKLTLGLSAALLVIGFGAPANATLIGSTVNFEALGVSFAGQTGSAVVGPDVEFTVGSFDVDVDATGITITAQLRPGVSVTWGTAGIPSRLARGLRISSLDWAGDPLGGITGVRLSSSGVGFGRNDVTFSADELIVGPDIRASGFGMANRDFVRIDLEFASRELPEPTTIALLGFGLVGLGLAARRRRRQSV